MDRGDKNSLVPIIGIRLIGFLLIAPLASFSAAEDHEPSASNSSSPFQSALYFAEDLPAGLVLVPEWLDASSQDPSHQSVSHLEYQPASVRDPLQLIIDDQKLAPPLSRLPSTWQASAGVLATSRLDEDILIDGQELGTGINSGVRLRLENRSDRPNRAVNAWDVIAIGINGRDSQGYDPYLLYTPYPYQYEASFVSVESNAIHRTQHERRVRQQFLGLRYIDQSDFLETTGPYYDSLPRRQETHNRMLGLQAGLNQSWSNGTRLRFAWGVKAGVFYSTADQAGYVYNGTANSFPLLLDCHADLACRIIDQAYLGIGLIGISLQDQYQSRFAWQAPESTHQLRILGMRLGFDYTY
jgi:hypothetical protein